MKKDQKSPLKGGQLRNPGQSLQEKIVDAAYGDGMMYASIAIVSIVMACLEWWRWYKQMPFSPLVYTGIAILVVALAGYKIFRIKNKIQNLMLGRDGEIEVGHQLDELKVKGYRVFHDLIGDDFNVDHVVICEHGVFTVETKAYLKPKKGKAIISVDNEVVRINGGYPSDEIAIQAKAEANWLQKLIREATEKKIKVHPAVLFPGWYVDSTKATDNIWFLNPDQLPALIREHKKVLSHNEVVSLTYCISQYIRTK